jgi:hypothetical protein
VVLVIDQGGVKSTRCRNSTVKTQEAVDSTSAASLSLGWSVCGLHWPHRYNTLSMQGCRPAGTDEEMIVERFMRYFLTVVSVIQLIAAAGLALQWSFVVDLWPLAGTTPLTFIFVASIFAAAAASTLWVVVSGQYGALVGIGIDYFAILAPSAILLFRLGATNADAQLTRLGVVFVSGALLGIVLIVWSVRMPIDRTLPLPTPVRWAFVIFIGALLIVSTLLILKRPVIPWTLTPELSVLIGWMFLGAAFYFAYGLLRPSWNNAGGQLAGFLAYDLVLVVPFLKRLPTTAAEFRTGMIVYTLVVVGSGLLAIYYLFVHKATRLLG